METVHQQHTKSGVANENRNEKSQDSPTQKTWGGDLSKDHGPSQKSGLPV